LNIQDDALSVGFSKRTFQRDVREIRNIFGVDIEYSKILKGYFVRQNEMENMNFQRMVEAFDMFNSLNLARDAAPFIHVEKRRPQGTENLYGLLHAIKSKVQVKFSYQKFWEDEISWRKAEPYALKEFKNRWYLLAKQSDKRMVKTFALDRLTNLEITNLSFESREPYNIEQSFRYCFGIISPNNEDPQEIILSFNPFQGKYIKSLPLHETQTILVDNQDELRIKLTLYLTHDLMMELLSYGDNMKVIEPQALVAQIKTAHEKAYEQYLMKNDE